MKAGQGGDHEHHQRRVTIMPMKSSMLVASQYAAAPAADRRSLSQSRSAKDVQDHLLFWRHMGTLGGRSDAYSPEHKRDTLEEILESARGRRPRSHVRQNAVNRVLSRQKQSKQESLVSRISGILFSQFCS
jgi:hypothetical protein